MNALPREQIVKFVQLLKQGLPRHDAVLQLTGPRASDVSNSQEMARLGDLYANEEEMSAFRVKVEFENEGLLEEVQASPVRLQDVVVKYVT